MVSSKAPHPAVERYDSDSEVEDLPPPYTEVATASTVGSSSSQQQQSGDPGQQQLQRQVQQIVAGADVHKQARQEQSSPAPSTTPAQPSPPVSQTASAVSSSTTLQRTRTGYDDPIVIPQRHTDSRSQAHTPFIRAYPLSLGKLSKPLGAAEFLKFMDALNETLKSNMALDGVGALGSFIESLPLPIVGSLLGSNLKAASKAGAKSVSRSYTKTFLDNANLDMFEPRGLEVRILKTPDMMDVIDMPMEQRNSEDPPIAELCAPLELKHASRDVHKENWMRRFQDYTDDQRDERRQTRREVRNMRAEYRRRRNRRMFASATDPTEEKEDPKEERKQSNADWIRNTLSYNDREYLKDSRMWLVILPLNGSVLHDAAQEEVK